MFDRFMRIWPDTWAEKIAGITKEVKEEWEDAIKFLTRLQLDSALAKARVKYDFPPTIKKFMDCIDNMRSKATIDTQNRVCVDRKHNIWVSKCMMAGCGNPGSMSRDVRGDGMICNEHYKEGK